ncbi:MAG: TetR family transcriptional regulator, partial [Schaalia georgiae]|nr:TetR family transcriptional regulator [Schaalia georgiae]
SGLIARHLVALSDGMQLQWLCDRADGVEGVDMTAVMSYAVGEVKRRWLVREPGGS